jgi:hypothetical protein
VILKRLKGWDGPPTLLRYQGTILEKRGEDLIEGLCAHRRIRGVDRNPVWLKMRCGKGARDRHVAEALKVEFSK